MTRKHWLILWCAVGAAALVFDLRRHVSLPVSVRGPAFHVVTMPEQQVRVVLYEVVTLNPLPGGNASAVYDLDETGRALGFVADAAFPGGVRWVIWRNGTPELITPEQAQELQSRWGQRVAPAPVPGAWKDFIPHGANRHGQTVGVRRGDDRRVEAFLHDERGMICLRPLPGFDVNEAMDINDKGITVGWARSRAGRTTADVFRAVLWDDGKALDLNERIPWDSGWELWEARAINDRGQIIGNGLFRNKPRAFLLNPR